MNRQIPALVWQLAALSLVLANSSVANAQNLFQDYLWNPTGHYSPNDPWVKGHVFRTHTGHDGLFYNCDGEENKRCSPWIHWPQRPCDDLLSLRRVHEERVQTICNAVERVRMGSCRSHCGSGWGTGYPPGAGYGTEPVRRPRGTGYLPNTEETDAIRDPGSAPDSFPAADPLPPPDPVPALNLGGGTPGFASPRVVDLPAINHLKRVPRS